MKQPSQSKIKSKRRYIKNKNILFLVLILLLAAFLLFYKLSSLIPFIGDQGWFYISARDMLLTRRIPLVGITSSHVWLHQGPYWTYMLAAALWKGHFNPIDPAYLTASIGLVAVWMIYKVGSEVFSPRVGLIVSLLYATAPLVIYDARQPYHTSPIAFLTLLLFYTMYKWINGLRYGFPLVVLLLTALYNFETATFMLVPVFVLVLIYGFFKKTDWFRNSYQPRMLLLAAFAWIVIMIPMILYDIHHGYPQTVKFILWLGYKIATVFGFPKIHPDVGHIETLRSMLPFASMILQHLIFVMSSAVSWILLTISALNLLQLNLRLFKKRKYLQSHSLLFLFFIIPAVGYIVEKTNSGAYWDVFFPTFIFLLALLFDRLMSLPKFFFPALGLLLLFVFSNVFGLLQTNYLFGTNGFIITKYEAAAAQIVHESDGKEYNLVGKGPGSQYESFTMDYEYLTWWMGHGPSNSKEPLKFIIEQMPDKIIVTKKN